MNNEKIKKALINLANERLPDDVHKISDDVSRQFKKDLVKTELNLWERIMNNPITKYVAVAAVLVVAALAGAQIFTAVGNNRVAQQPQQPDVPVVVEVQENTDLKSDGGPHIAELTQDQNADGLEDIKRMFAAGDIESLISVLGNPEAKYEYKIAAANYLAKIGDMQAIEALEELSRQWQGEKGENPFAAAIATIKSQQKKEIEPIPVAVVPDEPVEDTETDEPVAVVSENEAAEDKTAEKIDLRLNLKKGQKFGMKLTVGQKISQTVDGQEQKINQNVIFGTISEVLAVDSGIIALKATYSHIQTKMDGPMGLIEYDSTKPPVDPNTLDPQGKMMTAMWSAMAGQSFIMDLTPTGEIIGVKDFDKMWERMMEEMAGDDPQMGQAMKDMMKKLVSEDALKQSGGDMMMRFLDEPVAIGDMWYDMVSLDLGFPIDIDAAYILKNRKDGIAFIDVVSKMDMGDKDSKLIEIEGMKMNMQLSGTLTGTSEIDETTGWILRSKIEQNFFGVVKIAPNEHMPDGMSIPMTIQSTSTIEPMELK